MGKKRLKKIGLAMGILVLAAGFYKLPVIPQYRLMEVFTEDGGYVEENYEFTSIKQFIKDYPCSLHCFPSTDETVRFNVVSIGVVSLIFLGILSLLVKKYFKIRK